MKLYELTAVYKDFLEAVEAEEIDEAALADTLESIQAPFEEKIDNVACIVKALEAEAAAIKAEKNALAQREKTKLNRAEFFRRYIASSMLAVDCGKIETARNSLSFRKSEKVEIVNEPEFITYLQQIGLDEYLTYKTPEPNKTEIKKALKNGVQLIGAQIVENQNLQIK